MKVKVEYEIPQVNHVAVQCPSCKSWFKGRDIADIPIRDRLDIKLAKYHCPLCDTTFADILNDMNIMEVSYPEIYQDCKKKTEMWK